VEDQDEEPPEPEDRMTPKAKNAWSKVKAEKKELAQKVKDLETRLQQAEKNKPPEMDQLLQLQRRIDEYEDRIGQLDITQTRAFKDRYEAPKEQLRRRGMSVLLRAGNTQEQASGLVDMVLSAATQTEIEQVIADQPVAVQGALFTLSAEAADLEAQKSEAIRNWKDTRALLETQETRDKVIQLAENIETATKAAVAKAVQEGNWMFADVPGNAKWNQGVAERTRIVKGIMRSAKPEELVKWVVEGVTASTLRTAYLTERQRAEKFKAELAKRDAMSPRLGGGGDGAVAPASDRGKPQSIASVVNRILS
jgi:uncharacterized protein YlxW (UPF0749 family)